MVDTDDKPTQTHLPSPIATKQLYACGNEGCDAIFRPDEVPNFCPNCGNQLYSDDKLSRATFQRRQVTNGNGKKRSEFSFNFSTFQLIIVSAVGLLSLVAALYAGATMMADRHFDLRMTEALQPPNGVVAKAILSAVAFRKAEADAGLSTALIRLERRLDRQELILCELYVEKFGRRPPDIVNNGKDK